MSIPRLTSLTGTVALGLDALASVAYGSGEHVVHAQLAWPEGGGTIFGSTGRPGVTDPWALPPGTFGAYVVTAQPDAVHDRAVAAGAQINQDLHETDYGSRDFAALDPEGNRWSFGTYPGEPVPC